jgi:hypothetical protein
MKTPRHLIALAIFLVIVALGAVQAFIHRNYEMDDTYITFCYARAIQQSVRNHGLAAVRNQIILQERPEFLILLTKNGRSRTLREIGLAAEYRKVLDGRKEPHIFGLFERVSHNNPVTSPVPLSP